MKKQGFTLIELLAVIVILAIITLIAVPIILNLIENTRISAAKRSAENYIDAVELYLVRSELDTNMVTLDRNNRYNVTSSTQTESKTYPSINELVEISGSKPTGAEDFIKLNEKGKVTDAKLTINGYEVEIKNGKITNVTGGAEIPLESITLNYTEQTMEKGSSFKLIPTFAPVNASNQEVEYTSSDESIVTVDALGNVTAVNTGSAKITVTSKENPSIKVECNITVVISATGLTIAPTTAEIFIGETLQLTGTIEPNNVTTNSLNWNSSNADIASVDSNGLVTGVGVGEVTITASTVNGIEATATITVKSKYKDSTNASIPELYDKNLTPVIYENNNWKVADISEKWYNYANQEWANAVILKDGITKNVGDTVNVLSEVQGMFVWVPIYEYKIEGQYGTHSDGTAGTQTQPGEIKVNFISSQTINPTSGYHIHPAFTFGTTKQSGIWLGKFETTGTLTTPTILPSVAPLTNQSVSAQFATAKIFNTYVNNSNLDFHMSKNSEWGAIAYLSQSKYGKYGNSSYTGTDKKIAINNCSTFITGIGGDTVDAAATTESCTTNTYETLKGQTASTTGNVTGIYDMSGGTHEHVMGVYNNTLSSSEFSEMPAAKYYDNYSTMDMTTACNNGICYGHSLSETTGWFNNNSSFFVSSRTWLTRGGNCKYTSKMHVFYHYSVTGEKTSAISFRVTLTHS